MNEPSYPVTVAVKRPDGSIENVRVGTAVKSGDGFKLTLGDLAIGGVAVAETSYAAPAPSRRPMSSGDSSGAVFPPYGRSKGAPVAGASMQDLEYYANGCRRSLGDASKSRWHDKERVLLAAIEAEIANQGGGGGGGGGGGSDWGGGGGRGRSGGGGSAGNPFGDDPPPHTDDDTPF